MGVRDPGTQPTCAAGAELQDQGKLDPSVCKHYGRRYPPRGQEKNYIVERLGNRQGACRGLFRAFVLAVRESIPSVIAND